MAFSNRGPKTLLLSCLAAACLLASACDSGSREDPKKKKQQQATGGTAPATSSTGGASTSSTPTTPTAPVLIAAPATTPALAVQQMEGEVVGLAFNLSAGASDLTVRKVEISSQGTIDESTVGPAKWVADLNSNGKIDPGEPELARAGLSNADNDPYVFRPIPPVTIPAGKSLDFLVSIDTTTMPHLRKARAVGQTIVLGVESADKITVEDSAGKPETAGGSYPLESTTTVELGEHVLISEIVVGPGSGSTSAEYVELFNPTGAPIALEDYYLTDYSENPVNNRFYWRLPSGADFGPSSADPSFDFLVRFPAGTEIKSGQVITIAVDGEGFKAAHSLEADFCMRNAGATASTQMLTWDGVNGKVDFAANPVHDNAGLTNSAEWVCLYTWDGTKDLIRDVDIVTYGTGLTGVVNKSPNQVTPAPDVRLDSLFDQDATESLFNDDQDESYQQNNRAPRATILRRGDFTEGNEIKQGGNGLTGNDETSEDLGATFTNAQVATPGQLP
jgi:hypothetical protein